MIEPFHARNVIGDGRRRHGRGLVRPGRFARFFFRGRLGLSLGQHDFERLREPQLRLVERHAILGTLGTGDARLDGREIELHGLRVDRLDARRRAEETLFLRIRFDERDPPGIAASQTQIVERHFVDRAYRDRRAVLRRHVPERRAIGDREELEPGAVNSTNLPTTPTLRSRSAIVARDRWPSRLRATGSSTGTRRPRESASRSAGRAWRLRPRCPRRPIPPRPARSPSSCANRCPRVCRDTRAFRRRRSRRKRRARGTRDSPDARCRYRAGPPLKLSNAVWPSAGRHSARGCG